MSVERRPPEEWRAIAERDSKGQSRVATNYRIRQVEARRARRAGLSPARLRKTALVADLLREMNYLDENADVLAGAIVDALLPRLRR